MDRPAGLKPGYDPKTGQPYPPRDKSKPRPPLLPKRVVNFTVAAIGHLRNGSPTCTQEQIDERLSICRGCEWFSDYWSQCTHSDCGCSVGDEQKYLNKLAWADQSCPIGKWGQATE